MISAVYLAMSNLASVKRDETAPGDRLPCQVLLEMVARAAVGIDNQHGDRLATNSLVVKMP